jgi:hypothetical protein
MQWTRNSLGDPLLYEPYVYGLFLYKEHNKTAILWRLTL